jgi:type II secretory pathway component PulF
VHLNSFIENITAPKLSMERRMELYRIMAKYNKDGRDLVKLFRNKSRRAKANKIDGGEIYKGIDEGIRDGKSIAESMRPYIPSDEHFYIQVAERKLKSAGMFESLVVIAESKLDIKKSFLAMSFMPAMIFVFGIFILGIITFAMAPVVVDMVDDPSKLSPYNEFIISSVVPFMEVWFPIIVGIILSIIIFIILTLPLFPRSPRRKWLDEHAFIYYQYREYMSAVSLVSLASSVEAGIEFSKYYSLQAATADAYFKSISREVSERLGDGRFNEAQAIDIGFYGATDIEQIYDYSEGSNADEAIKVIGKEATENAAIRIKASFKKASVVFVLITLVLVLSYGTGLINAASQALNLE